MTRIRSLLDSLIERGGRGIHNSFLLELLLSWRLAKKETQAKFNLGEEKFLTQITMISKNDLKEDNTNVMK